MLNLLKKDMKAIPHHLYGFVDRLMIYDSTVSNSLLKIDEILARGNTPIVVGGTGLYLNSYIQDVICS